MQLLWMWSSGSLTPGVEGRHCVQLAGSFIRKGRSTFRQFLDEYQSGNTSWSTATESDGKELQAVLANFGMPTTHKFLQALTGLGVAKVAHLSDITELDFELPELKPLISRRQRNK